jgi:transcriptional antiterminator NusG
MQHRNFTISDKIDTDRVMRAIGRCDRITRIDEANLLAASKLIVEQKPKLARWFCLQVKKGREFAVENSLSSANVEAFMPRERFVLIKKGRKVEGDLPLFPSYLLVRFVPSPEAFVGVKRQRNVVDIVGGASGYHVVPDRDVDVFKRFAEGASVPRVATDKTFAEGDEAAIALGPFAGFRCVLLDVRWSRQARARVLIDVDGRAFEIESMPLAFLKKL